MLLLYPSLRRSPSHASTAASLRSLARGDRSLDASGRASLASAWRQVSTHLVDSSADVGATTAHRSAVVLLSSLSQSGVLPLGVPVPASQQCGVGTAITLVVDTSNPFAKGSPCKNRDTTCRKREKPRDGGALAEGLTAVTRTLVPKPRPAIMPGINHKDVIEMAQRQPEIVEIAEELGEGKKLVMRIFARDGVIDEEEFAALEVLNRSEKRVYRKADDEAFGLAMIRVGRESDRVTRLGRQMFAADGGDAA